MSRSSNPEWSPGETFDRALDQDEEDLPDRGPDMGNLEELADALKEWLSINGLTADVEVIDHDRIVIHPHIAAGALS